MFDRYEYTVLLVSTIDNIQLERILNGWGKFGWELCHLDDHRCVVKRLMRPSVEDIGDPDAV